MTALPVRLPQGERCAPELYWLTVTHYDRRSPQGWLFHPRTGEGVPYRGLVDLLAQLEVGMDRCALQGEHLFSQPLEPFRPLDPPPEHPRLAAFRLHMAFRQNHSWQGELNWVEGKQTSPFRSVLELVSLLDSALAAGETGAARSEPS